MINPNANWFYISGICVIDPEVKESKSGAVCRTRLKTFSNEGAIAYIDIFARKENVQEMMVVCECGNVVLIIGHIENARSGKKVRVYMFYENGEVIAKTKHHDAIDYEQELQLVYDLDPIEVLGFDYGDEE